MITTSSTMGGQGPNPQDGAGDGAGRQPQPGASPLLAPTTATLPTSQSQPIDASRNAMERSSAVSLRAAYRSNPPDGSSNSGGMIRAVTPDTGDASDSAIASSDPTYLPRGLTPHETSPRSIPGGQSRRQGMVFNDNFSDPYESTDSSPPLPGGRLPTNNTIRPRTRTMDMAMLATQRANAPSGTENRHRVGSVSSSGSQAVTEEQRQPASGLESTGFPTIMSGRPPEPIMPPSRLDKKAPSRRLVKRQSSRPTSPPTIHPPSIDALPFPIFTDKPQTILLLIGSLCGKMRGEVEYQGESGGPWHAGVAYIDDDRGCLMFDSGQNGPFHIPLVADLRGCRVLPVDYPQAGKRCLELVSSNPLIEILLHPLIPGEFDFWLAALLAWQQMRPSAIKLSSGAKPTSPVSPVRPELRRRGISGDSAKPPSIIKVGNVQVWDKGPPPNPRAVVKRSSTRDSRSPLMAMRRVSCILQDNGEFKLMSDNNVSVLSTIDLSQLSRCAIQQLDHTVLDEEYCIAIFPMYAALAERLSIFRPVYLALDNRTHFEVWFALLRAFAVPDVYRLDDPEKDEVLEVNDLAQVHKGAIFRVEKTILVRVTEAKFKTKPGASESAAPEKTHPHHGHHGSKYVEADPLVGNYLAEVILDGEVRARTAVKTATKNPFWRDDCEFIDLPPSTPKLAVVLKRIEGTPDTPTHLSPTSSPRPSTNSETITGMVELSLRSSDAGSKDNEQWQQIKDEKQESIGSMLIKVAYEEHVVLLAKEYEPLQQLLHNFPSGLTTGISATLPGQLRRLAELFLNIFQVSGKAADWLMAMIEDEIDGVGNQASIKKYRFGGRLKSNESVESSGTDRELIVRDMSKSLAGEANLLFRGNTLLTQALECHMRRLGKEFLEETLLDKINEINDLNPDCEVDPSKLASASNGELEQHWNRLLDITTEVWQCIAASAKKLHPELRHILKYVRAVAEDRYYDFLRSVAYTSVSGFLFLRFICPAILSPKLFGLLRDHPRPRAQRTFTLVAKALQKMANLSTFGKREEWMEPMNRFLNAQRLVFREYIDQVCDIPAERGPQSLPPSYSTPVTILNRLGPTAREGFPSLPFLIDQSRNFATLVKLWVDQKPTDPNKQALIEGDLQVFSDLCIGLQQRADSCLAKHESLRPGDPDDQQSVPDELSSLLEKASLIESRSYSYTGSSVWGEADRPGSSGSETPDEPSRRSRDMRRGRDALDVKKASGSRHVSSSGTTKASKNGKMGRTILNGIMRIGGRAESPDSKDKDKDKEKDKDRK